MRDKAIQLLTNGIRALRGRAGRRRVLILGDSHVRVFEHWRLFWGFPRTRFEVVYVPGATASGIDNPASKSRARTTFQAALARREHDLVLVNLGEVDTAYTLWRRAERSGTNVERMMVSAAGSYCRFLEDVGNSHCLVVLSACLPTLASHSDGDGAVAAARAAVKASQQARTALALRFNAQVAAFCAQRGIAYLDCAAAALGPDGTVRREWLNPGRPDHHYARSTYARWLLAALRQLPEPARKKLG